MRFSPVSLCIKNFRRLSYNVVIEPVNQLARQRHYYTFSRRSDREAAKRQELSKAGLFETHRLVAATARFDSHRRLLCYGNMAAVDAVSKVFERLPKSVVPVHYEITIKPDLFKLVFEGTENVTLKVCSPKLTHVAHIFYPYSDV